MKRTLSLLLLAFVTALGGVGYALEPKQAAPLRALQSQMAKIQSVHLRVSSRILILRPESSGQPETAGNGSFEYWAAGEKFRISSKSDPSLQFMQDMEWAFNGQIFQILDHSMKLLSLRKGNLSPIATALPNPFFFAVEYLSREGDSCPGCTLKLGDLRDADLWNARLASAVVSTVPGVGGSPAIDITAESLGGQAQKYRVHLGTTEFGTLPVRVDPLDSAGQPSGLIEISSYRQIVTGGDTFHIPDKVVFVAWDPSANEASLRAFFQIEELSINQLLDAAVFEIPKSAASRVFDEDAGAFLKPER